MMIFIHQQVGMLMIIIALENVGTGTSFAAPIFTAYVDHIQESNNDSAASLSAVSGITNGFWDNNYATEYNGYIVIHRLVPIMYLKCVELLVQVLVLEVKSMMLLRCG
jgi:hypothetical protein